MASILLTSFTSGNVFASGTAPVAVDDTTSTTMNVSLGLGPGSLTANDIDNEGDELFVTSVFNPIGGVATLSGGTIYFTPNTDFVGTASFEYLLSDGVLTDTGLVSVIVSGPPDLDSDGVADYNDNCPSIANTSQENSDGDEMGDVCEDSDGDGFLDGEDECPIESGTDNGCPISLDSQILDEVQNTEQKLNGATSLITQIIDTLTGIQINIASILGLLEDPNFGLEEIKNEVHTIESTVGDISTKVDQMSSVSDTLVDTETIHLNGKLKNGDYVLLMDITPFESSTGHVAMKVPCDKQSKTPLTIVAGVAPNISSIPMTYVAPLSNPGKSCLYHGDIGVGITDIALLNTGSLSLPDGEDKDKKTVNFGDNAGYSVTITIKGS